MKKAPLFIIIMSFLLAACDKDDYQITDNDGNVYQGVKIGNQIWMTENLRVTSYPDGSAIPNVEGNTAWDELEIDGEAYCWYDNSSSNEDVYGGLYTWAAATNGGASTQGVCPDGWHLPSEEEWKELVIYLGGYSEAGYYLKEHGTDHWSGINPGASNSSGFTALPGGLRNIAGSFSAMGALADFWSSTESSPESAYRISLVAGDGDVNISGTAKESGFSVRCLKD